MRTSSSFLSLLPCFAALTLGGCGGGGGGGSASTSGPGTATTAADTELFVRRVAAGLDVVEVDLTTGTATSLAGPLPGTSGLDVEARRVTRAGDRVVVSISSTAGAPADTRYATFALDRTTHAWRDLDIASYDPVYSSDLGILVEGGTQDPQAPNNVRLVTYDGRTLFAAKGVAGSDARYPRLAAISPTGAWFAMRAASDAVDVLDIATDGTIGEARKFANQEPADTYANTVSCALPTTMVFAETYPKATWLDHTLAPVAAPAFTGTVDALPYQLADSGRNRVCRYQVTAGDVHDVYAFDDRSLAKLFSFAGKTTELLAVGDGVHLRSAEAPSFATLAKNDGTTLGTYAPLPMATTTAASGAATTSSSILATSLKSATKAAVFSVTHGVSSGDVEQAVEIDEELFVANADGTLRPTLRLRSVASPRTPNAAGFLIPAYHFTRDGSKLLYVLDGRIHVRAIDGDATADRLLDGANFVDVAARESSTP